MDGQRGLNRQSHANTERSRARNAGSVVAGDVFGAGIMGGCYMGRIDWKLRSSLLKTGFSVDGSLAAISLEER